MKRTAREIWEMATKNSSSDVHKTLMLFGHTPEEILKAIEFKELNEEKIMQINMTKKEAEVAVRKAYNSKHLNEGNIVDALDALGFKFKEEPEPEFYFNARDRYIKYSEIKHALEEKGYKITGPFK